MDYESIFLAERSMPAPQPRTARVTSAYEASNVGREPLAVRIYEGVEVSERVYFWNERIDWVWIWCTDARGHSGWVPLNYLDWHGSRGRILCDYETTELSVQPGDELRVEKEESGWAWCVDSDGRRGWVPLEHIE